MSGRSPPNYHRLENLGRGSFATVFRAVHINTNQEVAIKDISQEKLTLKLQENLESEISILKNHVHRNIVKLYDIERNDRHIYIILEYCRGGDLQRFIKRQPGARLTESVAQHFMRHLASGLKFLYDRNLVHRDIKPQNLLLMENKPNAVLKIADFGFARHLEGASMADTLCGSPLYMAPEILGQNPYNNKADLWSVGAVLFEMVAGRPPFAAQNQVELLRVIQKPLEMPRDVDLSVQCVNLLKSLLKREPLERISFDGFFSDPFVDINGGADDEQQQSAGGDAGETEETCCSSDGSPAQPSHTRHHHHHHHHHHQERRPLRPPSLPGAMTEEEERNSPPRSMDVGCSGSAGKGGLLSSCESSTGGPTSPAFAATPPRAPSFLSVSPPTSNAHHHNTRTLHRDLAAAGGGGGADSGVPFTSSSPARRPVSTLSVFHSANPIPSPRVNPFKPLAASPPGAAALALHGGGPSSRSSSSSSSSSNTTRRTNTSGLVPHPSLGGSGDDGIHSFESDGFVIVDSLNDVPPQSVPGASHSSSQHSLGSLGTLPQAGPSSSSSDLIRSNGSQQLLTQSTDSVEGALRVLTYVESSTRRAVLIASLGDAKALAGLSRGGRPGSEAAGRGARGDSTVLAQLSTTATSTVLGAGGGTTRGEQEGGGGSWRLASASGGEAKAVSLLLDALVLYLKALSVVGTAIKALRQVIDVLQTHMSIGSQGSLQALSNRSSSGRLSSIEERKDVSSPWSSGSASSTSSVQGRISSLRDWLEEHFSIILDRAEACRQQIHTSEERSALAQSVPRASAEELLYRHALSLAKEGAVKELLGQFTHGHELYSQAKLMMEALLAEPMLPSEDQRILEGYTREFGARLEELSKQCSDATTTMTTTATTMPGAL